jgi:hypothetical protein
MVSTFINAAALRGDSHGETLGKLPFLARALNHDGRADENSPSCSTSRVVDVGFDNPPKQAKTPAKKMNRQVRNEICEFIASQLAKRLSPQSNPSPAESSKISQQWPKWANWLRLKSGRLDLNLPQLRCGAGVRRSHQSALGKMRLMGLRKSSRVRHTCHQRTH